MGIRRAAVRAAAVSICVGVSVPALASDGLVQDYPRGTYVFQPDAAAEATPVGPAEGGGPSLILYLNRCEGGETVTGGQNNSSQNTSSIIGGTVNFPPFAYGDQAWNEVVEHTRSIFSPFNIQVTDVDPGDTPHDEAIVCGSGSGAGFGGAGGVAPFSCGVIPRAITFTFPESLGGNPRIIAEVIGQESAHAWGLDHEYLCEDPMTYLSGCGQKTFQDQDAQCGEFSARSCQCGGSTQNSYQRIMNTFGAAVPDLQAPTAAITYPADGDTFEVGADFEITVSANDDVNVAFVTLYADGMDAGEDNGDPWGPWPVTNIPEGQHEFYIEVIDGAGNSTMSEVVTINVTADGEPPPDDSGDESGGDDADADGDGGSDGDDGGDGEDGDSADAEDDALPAGYGGDGTAQSCACRSGDSAGFGWLLLLVAVGFGSAHRRRRSRR